MNQQFANKSLLNQSFKLLNSVHSAFIACPVNFTQASQTPSAIKLRKMLRHLKMELRREQQQLEQLENRSYLAGNNTANHKIEPSAQAGQQQAPGSNETKTPRRVRGRRSSKPQMEKRRRARINQCLDILKSYVLTDSTASQRHSATDTENQIDEETIARNILQSTGLINRHRGRKNPNKLEKADILELTVDYVRRLHQQRDQLILKTASHQNACSVLATPANGQQQQQQHMRPLTLELPATTQAALQAAALPSPPPSSASNSPQPLLSISSNIQLNTHSLNSPLINSRASSLLSSSPQQPEVLDLSDSSKRQQHSMRAGNYRQICKDGVIYVDDEHWLPAWNQQQC